MVYTISYDESEKIIVTRKNGEFSVDKLNRFVKKLYQSSIKYNCNKILIDQTEAKNDLSIPDLYYRPCELKNIGFNSHYSFALLIHKSSLEKEKYLFFEDTSINQGLNVRIFQNEKKAIKWLKT